MKITVEIPVTISERTSFLDDGKLSRLSIGGSSGRVTADQYWRCGTITYYEANMDLLQPLPARSVPGRLAHPDLRGAASSGPQHGRSGREAEIVNCMLASGTLIVGGTLRHAILFPNVRVEDGAVVENSLLFEGVTVGEGAQLRRCIIDKHVAVPPGERIGFDPECDAKRFTVSESGITVIPKAYRFTSL